MGSINGGYYFNVLYLRFSKRQVISATIEGPIPVCERIFANTGTCGYMSKDRIATAGPLMEWKFHNKVVRPNAKVQAIYTQ